MLTFVRALRPSYLFHFDCGVGGSPGAPPDGVPVRHVTAYPQVLAHTVKFFHFASFPQRILNALPFSVVCLFLGLHHQVSGILGSFRRDVNQSFTSSGLALPRVSCNDAVKMS